MFDSGMDRAAAPPRLDEDVRRHRVAEADRVIGETAAHINAAYAELLVAIADFDGLEGWNDHGAKTIEDWVAWRCGVTSGDARHHVRIARRLKELPAIFAAFRRGELSYWQVRAMAPVATPEIEETLLTMARYTTATQLQRLARAYKSCLDRIELELANQRHAGRKLAYHFDDDGFLVLYGKLEPDQGAVLVAALEAAEEALEAEVPDDPAAAEPTSYEQRRADALVEVARAALAAPDDARAALPSALIHVDVPALIDGSGGRCELADGPVLASETARRLTCDAEIQALYEGDGEVRDVGRKKRTVPPRMRKALEQRDLSCVFPGCARKKFCHGHHIVHWTHHGKTKLVNLALLCPFHHRLVHEGGYSMRVEADGSFTFVTPAGRIVARTVERDPGDPRALIERHRKERLEIDERTCTTLWDGTPPNFGDCVEALLGAGGLLEVPRRGPPVAGSES